MTECDYRPNRQKIAEAIAIIARASAGADAAAHQPGKNDARFSSDVWQREFTLRTGLELSRCEVQSLLTTDDSDPVTGNKIKETGNLMASGMDAARGGQARTGRGTSRYPGRRSPRPFRPIADSGPRAACSRHRTRVEGAAVERTGRRATPLRRTTCWCCSRA